MGRCPVLSIIHKFWTPRMYSVLSSELVIPMVGKEIVEKKHGWQRDCDLPFFFLPANLICFISPCLVLPVSFSLDTENYFVIKSKSTLTEVSHVQIVPCRIPVARGFWAATAAARWQGLLAKPLCQQWVSCLAILMILILLNAFHHPNYLYMYIFVISKSGSLCVKTGKMSFHPI